jgi:hypothetical protein
MGWQDLPVPVDSDESVSEIYVQERNCIKSTEELIAFVKRWQPLFKLFVWKPKIGSVAYETYDAYEQLIEGTFNPEETLACMNKLCNIGECEHIGKYSCCGMHIMLPYPLIDAFLAAKKYEVPFNVALIQINGGFGGFRD